ncbi:penicillin-binding transpeptidase domain-containing protein [Candidatus Gromoviella agglomerans]|uniref:penicillin-binding transpeptidase domain-containing protein n=1 Tax=Candidatus Gromoviella agglomerans TaxID=2806609 RepID=UPI001E31D3FA|nr:penicillin-binding transpeptidase domain-containing protein [Candidatus Gromoviella agglomerans]UFX98439.1 Cell division protein FtsI/penicillin-binding protein 2 [Candidatus Gromoviella agglomerans]
MSKFSFSRRLFIFLVGKLIFFIILIHRLFFLQIKGFKKFSKISRNNSVTCIKINHPRGKIFDRNGLMLAGNDKLFRVIIFAKDEQKIKDTLQQLKKISPKSRINSFDDILLLRKKHSCYMCVLASELTWDEMIDIEERKFELPNIFIDQVDKRFYTKPYECAHVLGYIDKDNKPKSGIEKMMSDKLVGTDGQHVFEVDASRNVKKFLYTEYPISGKNVNISIDANIQEIVFNTLKKNTVASCAVIMNENGEILSACSYPSFDYELLSCQTDRINLFQHPLSPLVNRAFSGLYMPGSIMKMVIGLSALHYEKIDSYSRFHCAGSMIIGGHVFHCWKENGHGYVNLEEAIACSCDIFFYNIGQMVGIKRMSEFFRKFGINQDFDLIPELKTGVLPDEREAKYLADTVLASIGHGYFSTTALHLCTMMTRLVTNKAVVPTLIKGSSNSVSGLNVRIDDMNLVLSGMYRAFNDSIGTGISYKSYVNGIELIGKTTTTQVVKVKRDSEGKKLLNQANDWWEKDHSMSVCSGEINGVYHTLCIIVEHGGWGKFSVNLCAKIFNSIINGEKSL